MNQNKPEISKQSLTKKKSIHTEDYSIDSEYDRPTGYTRLSIISTVTGILIYLIIIKCLGKTHELVVDMVVNFKTSAFWVVAQLIFFLLMLVILIIAIRYGHRGENGVYQYKKKHKNVIVFLKYLYIFAMITMGFMLGILFVGA